MSSHSKQSGSDIGSPYLEGGRLILPDLLSSSAGGIPGVECFAAIRVVAPDSLVAPGDVLLVQPGHLAEVVVPSPLPPQSSQASVSSCLVAVPWSDDLKSLDSFLLHLLLSLAIKGFRRLLCTTNLLRGCSQLTIR